MASPLVVDWLFYMVSDSGVASCMQADNGQRLWRNKMDSVRYWASPVYAAGKLYFPNDKGKITVIKADRSGKVLTVNKLDDGFYASPAVVEGALILRTTKHLYRVEQ